MTRSSYPQDHDLPDFLQNSPYIPLSTGNDHFSTSHHVQRPIPAPTLSQILRSKRARQVTILLVLLCTFLYFRSQAQNHDLLTHLGFRGPKCLLNPPVAVPELGAAEANGTDWTQFAYVQYVTTPDYLCNAVMMFEALHRMGSKPDRLLMYPSTYSLDKTSKMEGFLLLKAKYEYGVTLVPIDVLSKDLEYQQWASSYTKLLAFNQTTHSRLLVLDSDATLLAPLDALFLTPPSRVSTPRAYWLPTPMLASHIMLITPSAPGFSQIQTSISKAKLGIYDMEIVNALYGNDCVVLPHRKYALLSGEFRGWEHGRYGGEWDVGEVIKEARYVHFSDDPRPKPWVEATEREIESVRPICDLGPDGHLDCRGRDFWDWLYEDFKTRRMDICDMSLDE
ncbi:Glucose N-acetyltransferase [Lachnellula hyalina]|uniref:Glucose N-acetyltransferase n=1 Tax=Lachnellula hyalina TaxID=1316788 RepID=A0A8H8U041_9HELO|nr:Glucose N-acetyltransferase [Lachnellula hyalina]TVY28497.1 Glucose N-acetyltransferase [Lachnellula hyalina]